MTEVIISLINSVEDLRMFSTAYRKGEINLNISKLSRELKVDRKTIRAKLNNKQPKKTRNVSKYLDSYRDIMVDALTNNKQFFDYKEHLYTYMKREHKITCSRVTLVRYVNNDTELSKHFKNNQKLDFTERFETKPGQQAQFDLKEKVPIILANGEKLRVNVATLTLGFSRYNIRKIVLDTQNETIINFLAEAFEMLGGCTKELVIDNIKCLVNKPRSSSDDQAILNSTFDQFLSDYNIKCIACMPYRPQTKGKTETQNKKPGQLKNYNGTYADLLDVHNMLNVINTEDNVSISQATKLPRIFLLEKEKDDFTPLPTKNVREKYHLSIKQIAVSNESMITYKGNKYSVPKSLIGTKVDIEVRKQQLHIYYNNMIIVVHNITNKLLNIHPQHDLKYLCDYVELSNDNSVIIEEMRNIKYD